MPEQRPPDGSTLYTGSIDGNALAWDLTAERGFAPSFLGVPAGVPSQVYSLAVSSDSTTVATGGSDGVVSLWDAATLRKTQSFQAVPNAVVAQPFSPDGRSLLVAGDTFPQRNRGVLRIWRLGTQPRLIQTMQAAIPYITNAALSPDGKLLGPPAAVKGEPIGLSFSPRGTTVAISGANSTVEMVDPATGAVKWQVSPGGPVIKWPWGSRVYGRI